MMQITPLSSLANCEPPLRLSESRLKNHHNVAVDCDASEVENNEGSTDVKENKNIQIS